MASGCFDLLAAEYDRTWTFSNIGVAQRAAVWRRIGARFRPGDRILDLGCGTGEDAARLARLGAEVTAIDASPEMVRIARERGVNAQLFRIEDLATLDGRFDAVISNFGALNCIADLSILREPLARLVRPSGFVALCVMSRFCLLESLSYMRKLQFRRSARRWSGSTHVSRMSLDVFYPPVSRVARALHPHFQLIERSGIGLAVPPSYVSSVSAGSLQVRSLIDQWWAHLPLLRSLADHQLLVFVRESRR